MAKETPKVACIDVDNTLGRFERAHYAFEGFTYPESESRDGIRFGMPELLEKLRAHGFTLYATSSGNGEAPHHVLEVSGLLPHMDDVFNGYDLSFERGKGKYYDAVADMGGVETDQEAHDMIVIGDSPHDQPANPWDIVFILDRNLNGNSMLDAAVLDKIIFGLIEAGNGSFLRGFEQLFSNAPKQDNTSRRDHRTISFGDVQCLLYRTIATVANAEEIGLRDGKPVVEVLPNPEYMRPLVPFETPTQ